MQQVSNAVAKLPGGITGKGFVKGQSGNPSGKRKGSVSIAAWLKDFLAADPDRLDALGQALYAAALAGDAQVLKLVFDRVDGPVREVFPDQPCRRATRHKTSAD